LEGVGTLVYSGQRFPNIRYKLEVDKTSHGIKLSRGTIDHLPQRVLVQIELKGVTSLELQSGERVGIMFEQIHEGRPGATFVVIGPDPVVR
jgi:hypothetical protein